ncbi:hypothetical protein GCM10011405_11650 [Rufibacter glacialis]|nr:hypothetical protein GCM10011405_11650 [Rufibacter glacialis]
MREGKTGPRGRERTEGSHATTKHKGLASDNHYASNGIKHVLIQSATAKSMLHNTKRYSKAIINFGNGIKGRPAP